MTTYVRSYCNARMIVWPTFYQYLINVGFKFTTLYPCFNQNIM